MEFNENQAEILSQAVKQPLTLALTDYVPEDVRELIFNGLLTICQPNTTLLLVATAYGRTVVKVYEREQAAYQRGYHEGYDAGMYAGKHTGYSQ